MTFLIIDVDEGPIWLVKTGCNQVVVGADADYVNHDKGRALAKRPSRSGFANFK
jgi:hypothetical protein